MRTESRALLPEYKQLIAHNAGYYTQAEAALLTQRIFREAVRRRLPIIWEAMHSDPAKILIEPLRKAGYELSMIGVTIEPYEAMKGVATRLRHKALDSDCVCPREARRVQ